MRIAHTSDWPLGPRPGWVDRTDDLKRAVDRIATICQDESVDVLLICGDLFSGNNRTETIRHWMAYLNEKFKNFLLGGGTILALTGNHDNENLSHVLRQAMALATPAQNVPGA